MNLKIMQNLELYEELITCSNNVYSWIYDSELNLVHSNCPNQEVFGHFFTLEHKKDALFEYFEYQKEPVVLSNSIDMAWAVDIMQSGVYGESTVFFVIGPVFFSEISTYTLEQSLNQLNLSIKTKKEVIDNLKTIPIIPYVDLTEYVQMLHFCITREKIPLSKVRLYGTAGSKYESGIAKSESKPTFHGTWNAEQLILKMIEDGNLDYRKKQDELGQIGHIGKLSNGEPSRQFRNQIISFIVLASRAAIRGGVDPEIAYTLSDMYIQNVEAASSFNEITMISHTMQDDFVNRVHMTTLNNNISPQIKKCKDYIQLHLTDSISLLELASLVGYSKNYLCKKFKNETGKNIRDYINEEKIEYSKNLLISDNISILQISETLHFCSCSRYCELFRELTKMTPTEYRNSQIKKL